MEVTMIEICDWCKYIIEKNFIENDDDSHHTTCPCCGSDILEIQEI